MEIDITRAEFLKAGDQFKRPGTEEWLEIAKTQGHCKGEQIYFITSEEDRTFLFPRDFLLETV